eukprot:scaffold76066_cov18-Tisochrysis_lutea.AAC.2
MVAPNKTAYEHEKKIEHVVAAAAQAAGGDGGKPRSARAAAAPVAAHCWAGGGGGGFQARAHHHEQGQTLTPAAAAAAAVWALGAVMAGAAHPMPLGAGRGEAAVPYAGAGATTALAPLLRKAWGGAGSGEEWEGEVWVAHTAHESIVPQQKQH